SLQDPEVLSEQRILFWNGCWVRLIFVMSPKSMADIGGVRPKRVTRWRSVAGWVLQRIRGSRSSLSPWWVGSGLMEVGTVTVTRRLIIHPSTNHSQLSGVLSSTSMQREIEIS